MAHAGEQPLELDIVGERDRIQALGFLRRVAGPLRGQPLHPQADRERSKAVEQVASRIEGHHTPHFQHGNPPAQRFGFFQIMRGENDGMAVGIQAANELPQALPQLDVHARRRLVEHDHRRLVHQGLGHQDAAFHAARQRAHVDVGLRRQSEVRDDFVDPVVIAPQAEIARLDAQRLADGKERVEHELLWHDAQHPARLSIAGHDVVPHDAGSAAVGAYEAGEDADQRRLAGTIGAQQSEELALLHHEVDRIERLQGAIALGHAAAFDGGHGDETD